MLRAPVTISEGLAGYAVRDEFNHSAGSLTGKAFPAGGGSWTAGAGAGHDADDFAINTTDHTAERTAVSDTATSVRNARLVRTPAAPTGPALSDVVVQVDVVHDAVPAVGFSAQSGLAARYNPGGGAGYLLLDYEFGLDQVNMWKVANTTVTFLGVKKDGFGEVQAGELVRLRLLVNAKGEYTAYVGRRGQWRAVMDDSDADLATGGSLASGGVGLWDWQPNANAVTRTYDNFAAFVPAADAVIFPNQSAELRTEGFFRYDASGGRHRTRLRSIRAATYRGSRSPGSRSGRSSCSCSRAGAISTSCPTAVWTASR